MFRAEKASSKLLQRKWQDRDYAAHRRKLANVKSTVDNGRPKEYLHLRTRRKKIVQEEERLQRIERDNRILLEKMSRIMTAKRTLDNRNDDFIKRKSRSLNEVVRRERLRAITRENQRILAKIKDSRPTYDHTTWAADRRRNEAYLRNVAEYPVVESGTRPSTAVVERERAELDAQRRAAEEQRVKMELLKRPRKARTYRQKRRRHEPLPPAYSPDSLHESSRSSRGRPSHSPRDRLHSPRDASPRRSDSPERRSLSRRSSASEVVQPAERFGTPTTVKVVVVSAENLAAADTNGKSDAYISLGSGDVSYRTQTRKNTLSPTWDESFTLTDLHDTYIWFEAHDDDLLKDDTIGGAVVDISRIQLDAELVFRLGLVSKDDQEPVGTLMVKLVCT